MQIEQIDLLQIAPTLVQPFRSSTGVQTQRECTLVGIHSEGITGWGECVAMSEPDYSAETQQTAYTILATHIVPLLLNGNIVQPSDLVAILKPVRGNPMAKAAVECAVWDWFAKKQGVCLAQLLGKGRPNTFARARIPVGVSVGIQPTVAALLERVGRFIDSGYQRIKIKIKPGWDIAPLQAIRYEYPTINLMADANSAYTVADIAHLQQFEAFDLLMIEQPFAYNDFVEHAQLQRQTSTPICLDESIDSPAAMATAIALGACQVVNLKVGRVGGIHNLRLIHDLCVENGIALWCGGMLETAIGRATNVQLATLPGFILAGDISATDRYFAPDIATPPFVLNSDSTLTVPTAPGIGVVLDQAQLAAVTVDKQAFFGRK